MVYDEVIYAPIGVLYWKTGDLRWNKLHPPLQKYLSALPLLTQKLDLPQDADPERDNEWRTGYKILFQDLTRAPYWTFLMRLPSLLVALLLILVVFFWTKKRFGFTPALLAGGFLAFDPLFLGNAALAMDDIFLTAFFFASVLLFRQWMDGKKGAALACGVMTGLTLATKLTGLLLFPTFFLIAATSWKEIQKKAKEKFPLIVPLFFSVTLLAVLIPYKFDVALFSDALTSEFLLQKSEGGRGFFLGPIPNNATWFYYPLAVLIKTPLPLLLLWIFSIVYVLKHAKKKGRLFLFNDPCFSYLVGFPCDKKIILAYAISYRRPRSWLS